MVQIEAVPDDSAYEDFNKLLDCIKQMQTGTTALIRQNTDAANLMISSVRLSEDLTDILCTPVDQGGEALTLHVTTDIDAIMENEGDQSTVSIVCKLSDGDTFEMVFATDADCMCWKNGLNFLKGALQAEEEQQPEKPKKRPAPSESKSVITDKIETPVREGPSQEDFDMLMQKNKELVNGETQGSDHPAVAE